MYNRIRSIFRPDGRGWGGTAAGAGTKEKQRERPPKSRATHNLFEAAATYISASAADDHDRMDEAAGWVSPEALSFGVSELATRAVLNLARERGESPDAVARALLDLPVVERAAPEA
ncbi:hypothetical protein [Streptomyces cavernicola]|uniref:ANTAR domain-containing protein n=1 Tax=Streptomyces cavernicola TaxID=3043613 RepID=A0ABT6S7S2_9ACTN|nr:hypothetical protein [Streptomyces sp. B-S-A6]MDI3404128.1 hypothetical protein [Streptomyces sp. B-S-A6]